MKSALTHTLYETHWRQLEEADYRDPVRNLLAESIDYAHLLAAPLCAGARILDVGAGLGEDALWLAQQGATVYAVDPTSSSAQIIRRRAESSGLADQLKTVRMSGQALAFRNASFDAVFLNAVLMHVDHHRLFQEVHRVLKPHGRVIFHEPLGHNLLIELYRRTFSKFSETKPHYLRYEELRTAARGFQNGPSRGFFLFSLALMPFCSKTNPSSRIRRLYARLVRKEAQLLKNAPWLKRFCWILVGNLVKEPA